MSTANTPTDVTTPEPEDATFQNHHDDGVATSRNVSRWEKYGKDRIYLGEAAEGYVDLKNGEMVDVEPKFGSTISEYELEFDPDTDCLFLWAVGDEKAVRNSLSKKSRKEVARIPRDVMGWGNDR